MCRKFSATRIASNIVLVVYLFSSCRNATNIPFQPAASTIVPPVTKSLTLPAAVPIKWIITKDDSIAAPKEINFDINLVHPEPFYTDGFKPFKKPPVTEKINWSDLKPTPFRIDTVPTKPLVYRIIKVAPPERTKAGVAKSKTPVTKNILQLSRDEGLPGGVVQAIYQDTKGIYWLATGRGLCRYDGEYFELYTFISKEPQGSIMVQQIKEDQQGRLWIRTGTRGIYVFDYLKQLVTNIEISAYDLALDAMGKTWLLGTNGWISKIDFDKVSMQQIKQQMVADSGEVARILPGAGKQLIFRTGAGISVLNLESNTVLQWKSKQPKDLTSIFYCCRRKNGEILFATPTGFDLLNPAANTVDHFSADQGFNAKPAPYAAMEDRQGRIWHSKGDSGIEVIDFNRGAFLQLKKTGGLSENFISTICEDKTGKVWLGTETGGINIVDTRFSVDHLSVMQGLSSNSIWSIIKDDSGNVWMGSSAGVDVVNNQQHSIRHLAAELGIDKTSPFLTKLMKDKDGRIWVSVMNAAGGTVSMIDLTTKKIKRYTTTNAAFKSALGLIGDSKGRVWINVYGKGVALFDPVTHTFKHLNNSNGLAGNLPWRIMEAVDGKIWIATSKGLSIVAADASSVTSLHKSDGLSDDVTQALVQDSSGAIWVSTNEGIDRLDFNNNTITGFSKNQGMSENESFALESINNSIYAGTSSGINVIARDTKDNNSWHISNFARPQGFYYLDVNSNTSLVSLKENKIYWGIQQVVTVMDIPKTDSTVNPVYISGIIIGGIPQHFFKDGLLFTGSGRIDTIWSERKDTFYLKQNTSGSSMGENGSNWDSVSGLFRMPAKLSLGYHQNQLGFQFTNLAAANGGNTRYSYILEGLDDHWSSPATTAQSPEYNNLSPGRYVFKVCSKEGNSNWSAPASFAFTILPPWWNTWWAWLIYLIIFIMLLRAYIAYRSSVLRKENVLLEQKVNQRTIALEQSLEDLKATQSQLIQSEKMASLGELTAGIAHEIQNPLNFVNNFSEVSNELIDEMNTELDKGEFNEARAIASDIKQNLEKINHHGKRADAIVKGMLQHSQSGKGQKTPTNINALADEYLRLAYHGVRAKDNAFNATLKTEFDERIGTINIIPQDIGRVLLNLITNAFYAVADKKRSGIINYEPIVSISTKKINGKIEIRVADNGSGIPQQIIGKIFQPFFTTKPTGQGTGLGLSLSYDIIKAHGGEINVETSAGEKSGSVFIIKIPS